MPNTLNYLCACFVALSVVFGGSKVWSQSLDPTGFSYVANAFGGSFLIGKAGEELRDTVDHAQAAASALLSQSDAIAKARIEQIDKILSETVAALIDQSEEAALRVLEQAKRDIEEIEEQIFMDIVKVIREAECAVARTQDEIINVSLRGILPTWVAGSKRVVGLPYPIDEKYMVFFTRKTTQFEIDLSAGHPPDIVFTLIEGAYLQSIEGVSEADPAYGIVSAYANLSKLARFTMCLYDGHASSIRWARVFSKYQSLMYPWEASLEVES